MNLVDDLAVALDRHEIVPYFQPQVDMVSGEVVGAEALARWQHPSHGLLEPDIFIPAAQQHGIIDELGLFMVDEAWRCTAEWWAAGLTPQVAVNASATQLTGDLLTPRLIAHLESRVVPVRTMTVEITETTQFDVVDDAVTRLRGLRDRGLGISIDDFGTGYSTIERLDALPATELKIDISLVQDGTDEGYDVLIRTVEHAHERGLRVVAEGVETEEQRHRVELLRCHRAQGYLFARPMPAAEFGALLATSKR